MNKNYEKFAAVYDAIMDDSLYDKWTDFSLRHFPKDKKKLLELACGTGIQSVRFAKAGFDVTGLVIPFYPFNPLLKFLLNQPLGQNVHSKYFHNAVLIVLL